MAKSRISNHSNDCLTASNGDVRISLNIEIKAKYIAAFQQHEQHKRRVICNAVFKAMRAYPTIRIASQEDEQDSYSDDSYVNIRTGSSVRMQHGKIVPSSDYWPSSDGPNIAKSPTGEPSMRHSIFPGENGHYHDRRHDGFFINRDKLAYFNRSDENFGGFDDGEEVEDDQEEFDDDELQPDPEDSSDDESDGDDRDDEDEEVSSIANQRSAFQPTRENSTAMIARQPAQQPRTARKRSAPDDEDAEIRKTALQSSKKRKPLRDVTEQSKNISTAQESALQDPVWKKRPSGSLPLDDRRSKVSKVSGLQSAKGKKR